MHKITAIRSQDYCHMKRSGLGLTNICQQTVEIQHNAPQSTLKFVYLWGRLPPPPLPLRPAHIDISNKNCTYESESSSIHCLSSSVLGCLSFLQADPLHVHFWSYTIALVGCTFNLGTSWTGLVICVLRSGPIITIPQIYTEPWYTFKLHFIKSNLFPLNTFSPGINLYVGPRLMNTWEIGRN